VSFAGRLGRAPERRSDYSKTGILMQIFSATPVRAQNPTNALSYSPSSLLGYRAADRDHASAVRPFDI
jgi:hypothetical protein